ncbi:MAG: CO/xanthine dehydrogenase Mo-binding subunit [Myxococcota bacterium]|jgi:CO/xanthine dehydrogenase Mo-binding subunit/aerobic-type carbon monoxide dehydrogenase small subunit (CoxS/CutS family)
MAGMPAPIEISFTLDGEPVTLTTDPTRSVLDLLREDFGIRSLTAGCSPQGICGCCAAMVGGKPRLTCTLKAKSLNGKVIDTQLAVDEAAALSKAFVAAGGAQCGYCTPGILTASAALLRKTQTPSDAEINKALAMHVCRCTGWTKIRESIKLAGAMLSGEDAPMPGGLGGVDMELASLGLRTRIDDMRRPGMLHAALVFTPHARCIVSAIQTEDAAALPGVSAILTAADVPGERIQGHPIADWPVLVAPGEQTRCVADVLAVVVAESPAAAAAAVAAVRVEAEVLAPIPLSEGTVIAEHSLERGSGEEGTWAFRGTFTAAPADPAYLEADAALAVPLAEGFVVYGTGQDPFADRAQLAALLGVETSTVEIRTVPCGGAFGGRSEIGVQAHALLAAAKLRRPVRLILSHRDSVRLHPGRPGAEVDVAASMTEDGVLCTLRVELEIDSGGYASQAPAMMRRTLAQLGAPYAIPHITATGRCRQTSAPVGGAMRGLGQVPVTFAIESVLDQLAADAGIDPLDLRISNLADPADAAVIEALRPHFVAAQAEGRPVGIAVSAQGRGLGGSETARALVSVESPSEVQIHIGFLESGQGLEGRCIQAAAAATRLDAGVFTVTTGTLRNVDSGPTLAGVDGWLGLQAVVDAADSLSAALDAAEGKLSALVGQAFAGRASEDAGTRDGLPRFSSTGISAQLAVLNEKGAVAQIVAIVSGDATADPVGTIGLIEGGVHMGVGAAISEERILNAQAMPETEYRKLGVLKAKVSPAIIAEVVAGAGDASIDDIAIAATAPAIAAAIVASGAPRPISIPMKTTQTAKAMGVRPPRPARR